MKNILCFGDSNIYGFNPATGGRFNENERWSGVLGQILKGKYNIIEEGCNARTVLFKDFADITTCGIDYLPYCLYKYENLDMVILSLGLNDFQSAYHASVDDVIDGIRILADLIKSSEKTENTKIFILAPPSIRKDIVRSKFGCLFDEAAIGKSKEFAQKLKDFASGCGYCFFDCNDITETSKEDGIHISSESHKKIALKLSGLIPEFLPA